MNYILRKFGFYFIAAWASLTINFFLPRLMPGDPASTLFARFKGQLQPEALESLKKAFGLTDDPLLIQYWVYIREIFSGNFGISIAYFPAPVLEVMASGLKWTLFLAGFAVVISFTVGSLIGIFCAWKRSSWFDSILPPLFTFLGAFPYFWLAMLLLYVFGFILDWFPLGHAHSQYAQPGWSFLYFADLTSHAFLPAISIVLATLGGWILGMRNTMIATLNQDYVSLAKARGLSPTRVVFRYAARNALLPNLTSFGMALGFVLSGSLLTEIVFSYPGQGYLLVQAVRNQDFPLMQGIFLLITLGVLFANWCVDLVYLVLNPEARRST